METRRYLNYEEVLLNDSLVLQMSDAGRSHKDIIVALVNLKNDYASRIHELDAIRPRKIVTKDGKVFVWHCPDELIPETRLNASE